jgi:hypothetical protein
MFILFINKRKYFDFFPIFILEVIGKELLILTNVNSTEKNLLALLI